MLCHTPSFTGVLPVIIADVDVLKLTTLAGPPFPTVNSAFKPSPEINVLFFISDPSPFTQREAVKDPDAK